MSFRTTDPDPNPFGVCVLHGVRDRFARDVVGDRRNIVGERAGGHLQLERDRESLRQARQGREQSIIQPAWPQAVGDLRSSATAVPSSATL